MIEHVSIPYAKSVMNATVCILNAEIWSPSNRAIHCGDPSPCTAAAMADDRDNLLAKMEPVLAEVTALPHSQHLVDRGQIRHFPAPSE